MKLLKFRIWCCFWLKGAQKRYGADFTCELGELSDLNHFRLENIWNLMTGI